MTDEAMPNSSVFRQLMAVIEDRKANPPARSYTTSLFQGGIARIGGKVIEEAGEVVIARAWTLLEYNVPRAKLADAEKITPGFNSPTVNALEMQDWCAVQVMVQREDLIDVMDRLEAIGATAILETRINNCRL